LCSVSYIRDIYDLVKHWHVIYFIIIFVDSNKIFAIGNNSIFLDANTKTIMARGNPNELLKNPPNEAVYEFLTRGEKK
jgi:phospholipid/cholesterol/gamma-HCH transport system ATP-binding protein